MAQDRSALGRHPAAGRWRPDHRGLAARLAERLGAAGAPWPDVGAAALAERGTTGLEPEAFARRYGLDPAELGELESGHRPIEAVPHELRQRLLDWIGPAAVAVDDPEEAR